MFYSVTLQFICQVCDQSLNDTQYDGGHCGRSIVKNVIFPHGLLGWYLGSLRTKLQGLSLLRIREKLRSRKKKKEDFVKIRTHASRILKSEFFQASLITAIVSVVAYLQSSFLFRRSKLVNMYSKKDDFS